MPTMAVAPRMTKHGGRKREGWSTEKGLWDETMRERRNGRMGQGAIAKREEGARAYAVGIARARQAYAVGIACRTYGGAAYRR